MYSLYLLLEFFFASNLTFIFTTFSMLEMRVEMLVIEKMQFCTKFECSSLNSYENNSL